MASGPSTPFATSQDKTSRDNLTGFDGGRLRLMQRSGANDRLVGASRAFPRRLHSCELAFELAAPVFVCEGHPRDDDQQQSENSPIHCIGLWYDVAIVWMPAGARLFPIDQRKCFVWSDPVSFRLKEIRPVPVGAHGGLASARIELTRSAKDLHASTRI